MRDLSVRLGRQFSHRKRVLNVMEDTMLSGVYRRQRRDRRLLKWSFKAKVKRSLKRYTSEHWPENVLELLFVKYCLDGSFCRSFCHGILRWTNLYAKWSIDSLPCKVTVLIIAVFL